MWIFILILFVIIAGLIYSVINRHKAVNKQREIVKSQDLLLNHKNEILEKYVPLNKIENSCLKIESDIVVKLQHAEQLSKQIDSLINKESTLQNNIDLLADQDYLLTSGFYEFNYNFDNLISYERELKEIRKKQKQMIQSKTAIDRVNIPSPVVIDNSIKKGATFLNQLLTVVLQAFNGECDTATLKVNYKNIVSLESKIEKIFEKINKSFSKYSLKLSKKYLDLKIAELHLVHEFQEKKEEEKEEQKRIKEIMRDELKTEKEIEKAKADAEREEHRYLEALAQARAKAEVTTGVNHQRLLQKIEELTGKLSEAQENRARAISRAQMTKSGHVYIISNIGSFGENVYKIGMTRRLEPLDRVKELGDASVPFAFDVHAMIYADNAPELENKIHKKLADYQVNRVNYRKEFFRVELKTIKNVLKKDYEDLVITQTGEAKEYNQTLALEYSSNPITEKKIKNKMLQFTCKHCDQSLEAEESWQGLDMTCPSCNKEITVL